VREREREKRWRKCYLRLLSRVSNVSEIFWTIIRSRVRIFEQGRGSTSTWEIASLTSMRATPLSTGPTIDGDGGGSGDFLRSHHSGYTTDAWTSTTSTVASVMTWKAARFINQGERGRRLHEPLTVELLIIIQYAGRAIPCRRRARHRLRHRVNPPIPQMFASGWSGIAASRRVASRRADLRLILLVARFPAISRAISINCGE